MCLFVLKNLLPFETCFLPHLHILQIKIYLQQLRSWIGKQAVHHWSVVHLAQSTCTHFLNTKVKTDSILKVACVFD